MYINQTSNVINKIHVGPINGKKNIKRTPFIFIWLKLQKKNRNILFKSYNKYDQ